MSYVRGGSCVSKGCLPAGRVREGGPVCALRCSQVATKKKAGEDAVAEIAVVQGIKASIEASNKRLDEVCNAGFFMQC